MINVQSADASYLRILNVTLLNGRLREDADRDAVVINETLAGRV